MPEEIRCTKDSEFNSRSQVDLTGMNSQADNDSNDVNTTIKKLVQLKAYKYRRAEKATYHTLDMFTLFRASCIFHDGSGQEFNNKAMKEFGKISKEPKIV